MFSNPLCHNIAQKNDTRTIYFFILCLLCHAVCSSNVIFFLWEILTRNLVSILKVFGGGKHTCLDF